MGVRVSRSAVDRQPVVHDAVARFGLEDDELMLVTNGLDVWQRLKRVAIAVVAGEALWLESLAPTMRTNEVLDRTRVSGYRVEGAPNGADLFAIDRPVGLIVVPWGNRF